MEDKIYKITLADGTIIPNLSLNGNNFVSKKRVSTAMFANNMSEVIINDGDHDEVHKNMDLVQISKMGSEYWFVLRDKTELEKWQEQVEANLDYISMMADIDF